MGPFSISFGHVYILLAIDYMSKLVDAIPTRTNEVRAVVKFLRKNIFSRYGMLHAITIDQGTHFNNRSLDSLLRQYVIIHRLAIAYHPQISGQMEVSNRQIK